MSDLHKETSRGTRAKEVLENDLFKETLDILKKSYEEAIFQTTPTDDKGRFSIYLAYQILGKVENHLRTVMETGKLAEKQLQDLRKK
jgi:hypothetical protein|tara:strand:+ start:48 stop:308 length:261 start_codon:yes stop_codon:yes gene_type:complete